MARLLFSVFICGGANGKKRSGHARLANARPDDGIDDGINDEDGNDDNNEDDESFDEKMQSLT